MYSVYVYYVLYMCGLFQIGQGGSVTSSGAKHPEVIGVPDV